MGFIKRAFNEVAEESPCGHYIRYKKILGRGAFKDVYKGFHQIHNVEIAWNQICVDDDEITSDTLNSSEKQQTLLYSEGVLLKSLNHTNIMKCYTFWLDFDNKALNMITELFPNGSLRQYMKKLGCVDEQSIRVWGRQILQGLCYLHTQNPSIVHRDLKCDNIFIDVGNGEIKIGDFGLATAMEERPLRDLVGTPEFMAPEYYDEEYNELVDVYAFGMCLIEMATLECPYSECTNPAQIFKKVSMGVKPIALEKVKYPEVKKIIDKCLLPACLRPSAMELLKDSFFDPEISMEKETSFRSSNSSDNMDESILSGISALYNSLSLSDAYPSKLANISCDDSVLSGISALYNSMSLSDACPSKPANSSCDQSSGGDVSMNSRITFALSKDMFFLFVLCETVVDPHHNSCCAMHNDESLSMLYSRILCNFFFIQ